MLTEALLIAIVTALGGVLVELVKARKRQDKVVHEVTSNSGSSMKDAMARIEDAIGELRKGQSRNSERLATLEGASQRDSGAAWYHMRGMSDRP